MNILNKYNIYINSNKRISGTPENFTIQLDRPLLLTSMNTQFEMYVSSLTFPFNFHQINSTNNQVEARLNGGSFVLITITPGNYNILNLLTELGSKLNQSFNTSLIWEFTYNKNTGKVSLRCTTANTIEIFFSANTYLASFFGFTSDISFSNLITATSSRNVNVNPITYICLRSSVILSNLDEEAISTNLTNSDIIAKIPIRVPPQCYIQYEQNFDNRVFLNTQSINILDFYITDNQSRKPLDNQGLDYTMTITILETIKPDYTQAIPLTLNNIEPVLPQSSWDGSQTSLSHAQAELLKSIEDSIENLIDEKEFEQKFLD